MPCSCWNPFLGFSASGRTKSSIDLTAVSKSDVRGLALTPKSGSSAMAMQEPRKPFGCYSTISPARI
jgi:hypothetical protein